MIYNKLVRDEREVNIINLIKRKKEKIVYKKQTDIDINCKIKMINVIICKIATKKTKNGLFNINILVSIITINI